MHEAGFWGMKEAVELPSSSLNAFGAQASHAFNPETDDFCRGNRLLAEGQARGTVAAHCLYKAGCYLDI